MKTISCLILTILGSQLCSMPACSQELQIPAAKDNTIYSESDSSNGAGSFLFSGTTNVGNDRRALIKFDFSLLQPGDSIVSASLKLYLSRTISGDLSVGLYKMKKDWGESTSDAKFEEGGGATPLPGDATWNFAFFDTTQWGTAGGDYKGNASAEAIVGSDTGYYTWTGDTLISDIRSWVQRPDSNFGWILIIQDQDAQTSKRFNSAENDKFKPQLVLELTRPSVTYDPLSSEFCIFPNPSHGDVFIRGELPDIKSVKLFDISGRELSGNQFQITRISSDLISVTIRQKGAFLLRIDQIFRKIIVL